MTDFELMKEGAIQLAEFGFYLVKIHYVIMNGEGPNGEQITTCSCGKRGCKDSVAKHPVDGSWGRSATKDPKIVSAWYDDGRPWNIGVALGPCFHIPPDEAAIDVEDDSEEGLALADEVLKDHPPLLSFTSGGKSTHRIYRWSEGFPPVASVRTRGLEFRTGGVGLQTQSIFPPSLHRSGRRYTWIGEGLSGIVGGVRGLSTLK